MNKKKCPKCGEENPPEAVMCWACYTPLSGEAGQAAGGAPRSAATEAAGEEKKTIPPWQMAVIGVAVVGGLFVGVRTMMPPPPPSDDEGEAPIADRGRGSGTTPFVPPTTTSAPPPAGVQAPAPAESPYTVVVPPNPRLSVATMAILPTDGTASGPQAAALAAFTRRQYKATSRWKTLYIYVFADKQSAEYFADYMQKKKGAPLTNSDYAYLSTMWNSVLTRYTYTTHNGKRVERALYPSKNPGSWWVEAA